MKPELKKLLLLNLPYLLFVYLFAKCGQAYRLAAGADASAKLLHLTNGISAAFANPLPSLHPFDLCVGVVGAVAVRLIVYSKGKNRRVHETPSGNQTDFFYCNQSRNSLTLFTFRDSTLKNMPAGQWRCIIGQTDTLLSVSSRTAGAPRCFSLKSGAITTTPQCKCGCLRAMTYRQADTPLPSKSERSERRRQ